MIQNLTELIFVTLAEFKIIEKKMKFSFMNHYILGPVNIEIVTCQTCGMKFKIKILLTTCLNL